MAELQDGGFSSFIVDLEHEGKDLRRSASIPKSIAARLRTSGRLPPSRDAAMGEDQCPR